MRYKSIEEQNQKFISILKQNEDLMTILNYIHELKLPNFYIAAGWIYVKFLDTIFRTNYAIAKLVI